MSTGVDTSHDMVAGFDRGVGEIGLEHRVKSQAGCANAI